MKRKRSTWPAPTTTTSRLVAFTLPTHTASERVMQKVGMERVGVTEHAGLAHVLYRLEP